MCVIEREREREREQTSINHRHPPPDLSKNYIKCLKSYSEKSSNSISVIDFLTTFEPLY